MMAHEQNVARSTAGTSLSHEIKKQRMQLVIQSSRGHALSPGLVTKWHACTRQLDDWSQTMQLVILVKVL